MFFLLWLVLCLAGLFVIGLPAAIWIRAIVREYSGARLVDCPENQQPAAVDLDTRYAVATGLHGRPALRVGACTRWPERAQCAQGCVLQAAVTEPYAEGEGKKTKAIYHLPVMLAAFAAWCLGAIWHSQYLFRTRWMEAVGLTRVEVRQIRWWYAPHLLTVAVLLLFAYGVAWLLAVSHRKGVLPGVAMAVLLGAAVVAASAYGLAGLPRDLLVVEAGYAALAVVTVGGIVGGLSGRLRTEG